MKFSKWVKPMLVVGSALMLAACSGIYGSSKNHGGTGYEAGSVANTSGAGASEHYNGANANGRTTNGSGKGCPTNAYDCVYFAYDKSDVGHKYYAGLRHEAEYLVGNKGDKVIVEGNTDERGSREYNVALGDRRANAVAEILEGYGVTRDQIQTVSYGAERPWEKAETNGQMSIQRIYELNRRVDLVNKTK